MYDLNGDVATHLNRTAALVWRNCDGIRTVQELVTLVVQELGEPADEDVVLMALDTLLDHGLISGYRERESAAVALSRRRFFRRVGVVGAAALNAPVAYSMVVPTAAAALSNGGPQSNNNDNLPLLNQSHSSQQSQQSQQSSGNIYP